MYFELTHKYFKGAIEYFTEEDAPDWLTSKNTVKGSTMDHRWFWTDHILTLEVGGSIETDFRKITRVE